MTDSNPQPAASLKNIAEGPGAVHMVTTGQKISNEYLRKFLKYLIETEGKTPEEALNIFLDLDYLVEKNGLNDKLIEKISQSPETAKLIVEGTKEEDGSSTGSI